MPTRHVPVMLRENIALLRPERGGVFVDMTLGGGSTSEALLQASPDVSVIAIDWDEASIQIAREKLDRFGDRITYVRDDFRNVGAILDNLGVGSVAGVTIDPGLSADQLHDLERGFSFDGTGLDMRMDRRRPLTAREFLARSSKSDLAAVIGRLGDERWAEAIAAEIVRRRERAPISDAATLAAIVEEAVAARGRGATSGRRRHPATLTFMALRMYINDELSALASGVRMAAPALDVGGRLTVLTYDSRSDRLVKRALRELSGADLCPSPLPLRRPSPPKILKILTKRPLRPSEEEVRRNPPSRSARLRAAERLETV
ncbi:MAG: 16S rRNA (cytosine(1402)-N(4))-methyltransferase RsmH [Armatimonadota bacterium]